MGKERITFSTRRFLVGKAGPFPRLVFREEVMLALDQFSHLHSVGEHGGFLVGKKQDLNSAERYEIMVERFVPIPQQSDASRLVINQEHYTTVARALKNGETIVGWVHTHPGFGAFLSNFDKEQHQRFFPEPWQIAYVMDNHAQERVAFRLVDEEWSCLHGYYVVRDLAANEVGVTALNERPSPWLRITLAILALFLAIAGGSYAYTVVRDIFFKPETVEQVAFEPDNVVISPAPAAPAVTVQPVESESNPSIPGTSTIAPPSTVPRYVEYVVQRGDNLWSIAGKLWGDSSLFRIIAEENGIDNPSNLKVGQVLRVPADPKQ